VGRPINQLRYRVKVDAPTLDKEQRRSLERLAERNVVGDAAVDQPAHSTGAYTPGIAALAMPASTSGSFESRTSSPLSTSVAAACRATDVCSRPVDGRLLSHKPSQH